VHLLHIPLQAVVAEEEQLQTSALTWSHGALLREELYIELSLVIEDKAIYKALQFKKIEVNIKRVLKAAVASLAASAISTSILLCRATPITGRLPSRVTLVGGRYIYGYAFLLYYLVGVPCSPSLL
jgi:hypothetical protein